MMIRKHCRFTERRNHTFLLATVTCVVIYGWTVYFRNMKHEETHSNNGFTLDEATITRQLTLAKYIADTKGTDFVGFYAAIVPEVACPKLERVGSSGDGGKWTCNPFALPDNCVVYSLGVGMDISFEVQIDEITRQQCRMYSFDPDEKLGRALVEKKSERFIFLAYQIGGETNEAKKMYTVQDVMKLHKHKLIDFFKIDIEGGEFQTLPSLLIDKSNPVACQLFIEMHGSPTETGLLLQNIYHAGYYLFSKEVNPMFPQYCEFSFIHENCFKRYGVEKIITINFT